MTRRGITPRPGTRWVWRRVTVIDSPLVIVRGHPLPSTDLETATDFFWTRRLDLAETAVGHRRVLIGFTRDYLRAVIAGHHQSNIQSGPGHQTDEDATVVPFPIQEPPS